MSNFTGTIEVYKNVMGEYENIYNVINEFKHSNNLFITSLDIRNKKISYSLRDNTIEEDEVIYDFGNMLISTYENFDKRIFKFELYADNINKFIILYDRLSKIINKNYKDQT